MVSDDLVLRVENAYVEVELGHTGLAFTYKGKRYWCIGYGDEADLSKYRRMAKLSGHTLLVSPFHLNFVSESISIVILACPTMPVIGRRACPESVLSRQGGCSFFFFSAPKNKKKPLPKHSLTN